MLNETEAAIKLGITKELLYAYVRNAPKKHLGHNRKLRSVEKDGRNFFEEKELEEFDAYLREPWSAEGEKRPEIPSYIIDYLKTEIAGHCPISNKGYPLDNAHIEDYSKSFSHHHHNIIRIAKEEHTKYDNGVLTKQFLKDTKASLIEKTRERLRQLANTTPFQVRKPNFVFLGRHELLLELTGLMEYERVILIQGVGGIGKTQLLLNALDNVRYHNPVIWVDVEQLGSVTELALTLQNAISQISGLSTEVPFIEQLKGLTVTIVFDSLEKLQTIVSDQTETFIQELLSQTLSTQLLITTQIDLSLLDHPKKVVLLRELDDESSIELMNACLEEVVYTESELKWLLDFCAGHPLAIKLVSTLIKHYRSPAHVQEYIQANKPLSHPRRKEHDKSSALSVCIATVYSCLSTSQKECVYYLKYYPRGIKQQWAERLFSTFIDDTAVLRQFFFIDEWEDQLEFKRILLANPVRPFLSELENFISAERRLKLTKDALEYIMVEAATVDVSYIEVQGKGSLAYGIMRIEDELPNILLAFRTAQNKINEATDAAETRHFQRVVYLIASALGKFCFVRGYLEYGTELASAGIVASIALGKYSSASMQYMYLSQLQSRQFDFLGLGETVDKLFLLAKKSDDIEILAKANWAKAHLEFGQEDFVEARKYFGCALEILQAEFRKHNESDLDGSLAGNIAILMFEIAKTFEFVGDYGNAIPKHEEALKFMAGRSDDLNLASSYHHIAFCYTNCDRVNEGLDYYYKAINGFAQVGQYEYLVNSLSDLGRLVEKHSQQIDFRKVDEAHLMAALENITLQIEHFKLHVAERKINTTSIENIPYPVVSRLMLLVFYVGFSPYCTTLCYWAKWMHAKLPVDEKERVNFLNAVIQLSHAIGGVNDWRINNEAKDRMLNTIYQSCLIINGVPDLKSPTRVFFWLAAWMNYYKLESQITAEELWDRAWNSFDK